MKRLLRECEERILQASWQLNPTNLVQEHTRFREADEAEADGRSSDGKDDGSQDGTKKWELIGTRLNGKRGRRATPRCCWHARREISELP